jgi:nitrous oxide reductase accessory protein NosL
MKSLLSIIVLSFIGVFAFDKASNSEVVLVQSEAKKWCPISGLKIEDYYKTSYIAKLQMNGRLRQYSSLYSLVKDMKEYGIDSKSIQVVDVINEKYIKASKAHYVVGSDIKGTLSKKSKFAFLNKNDALKFQKKYGGQLTNFQIVLQTAQETLEEDESYFLKIKKKKLYPRGKKIFEKSCKKNIELTDFLEINELKNAIVEKKLCKEMSEKNLQALALYLWEVKRFGSLESIENRVVVKEDEKCPVCGMFTYKYPRWAAQIFYREDDTEVYYSFDGVKDLMKFYFEPQKWGNYPFAKKENITKILVTDYYSQEGIDGTKAYYVIRSDIYGPMGHEFIPFKTLEDAKTFLNDHFGKKILKFDQIDINQTYKLDTNE